MKPVSAVRAAAAELEQVGSTASSVKKLRLGMALLWTIAILAVCWSPAYWFHEVERQSSWFTIPNFDKAIHWSIFAGFAVLWIRVATLRRRYLWVSLAGLALAAVTELVQNLPLIGRDGNLGDALGDILGIAAGLAVWPVIEPAFRFIESRLFGKSAAPVASSASDDISESEPASAVGGRAGGEMP